MPSLTRRLFVASLSGASLVLSKSWEEPAFPSWSAEFIDRLLTDSPWAKPSTVRVELDAIQRNVVPPSSFLQIGLPGGGIGFPRTGSGIPGVGWPTGDRVPPTTRPSSGGGAAGGAKAEIFLTTRWASALPIRRARALQQFGRDGLESKEAVEILNTPPEEYVIEIAGFLTTMVPQGGKRLAAELKQSARLIVPGHRPAAPASCNVPEHGMHLMATLTFPRFDDVNSREGYIELTAKVRGMELQERFKLKEMTYRGKLEL